MHTGEHPRLEQKILRRTGRYAADSYLRISPQLRLVRWNLPGHASGSNAAT